MSHSFIANLGLNIIIPVVIMTRFTEQLGALPALLLALAFPLLYGVWDYFNEGTFNAYSALGIISVLLTGFIGVLALPAKYLALKEAGIPLLVGIIFFLSSFTKWDATTKLLGQILDIEKLHKAYKRKKLNFNTQLNWARTAFVGSFIFSAIANYVLTIVIVTAEPATPEFTNQIGRMTALAFPVIALPAVIIIVSMVYCLFWHIQRTTKKDYTEFLTPTFKEKT
jgi:hypothetical protein